MEAPAAAANGGTVALLCSDLSCGLSPVPVGGIAALLRRSAPGMGVFVVERLCTDLAAAAAAVRTLGADRLLVGCRAGPRRRQELHSVLARVGLRRGAVRLPDLSPAEGADPTALAEHTLVVLRAALARLVLTDVSAPHRWRVTACEGGVTRRDLFRTAGLAGRPVAGLRPDRCEAATGCSLCTLACPQGALRRNGSHVEVVANACSGCGACLGACPHDALSLGGERLEGYVAAARALVDELSRGDSAGRSVAIVCSRADPVPLGREWVPFEVPSLEMVSAGWVLQLRAAGVATTLVSCGDDECRRHAEELTLLCEALGPPLRSAEREVGAADRWGGPRAAGGWAEGIELREPLATTDALDALGALGGTAGNPAPTWRIESPLAPLGDLSIADSGCSACDLCSRACPTAALMSRRGDEGQFLLEFDAAACSACGACVAACPEGVVSLRRVVDSRLLRGGRRALAAVAVAGRCSACGQPLGGGISAGLIGRRLADSHPLLAARMASGRCADCLLAEAAPRGLESSEVGLSAVAQ